MIRLERARMRRSRPRRRRRRRSPLFMSTAPRPWSRPPRISGANGSLVQPSPGGTTSRWPAKAKWGAPRAARREQILDRPVRRLAEGEAVDREAERGQRLLRARRTPRRCAGVTLGQAISRAARSTGSIAAVMRPRLASGARRNAMPKLDLDAIAADQPHRLSAALRRADGQAPLPPARPRRRA